MTSSEAVSILKSNCARLIQIVDNQEMNRIQSATDMASDAMAYRVPKAPVPGHYNTYGQNGSHSTDIFICPRCGNAMMAHYNCCPNCGQVLKWGDH